MKTENVEIITSQAKIFGIKIWFCKEKFYLIFYPNVIISFSKIKRTKERLIRLLNRHQEYIGIETYSSYADNITVLNSYYKCYSFAISFNVSDIEKEIKLSEAEKGFLNFLKKTNELRELHHLGKKYRGPSQMKFRANHYHGKCKK